jgi:hypothetical protein
MLRKSDLLGIGRFDRVLGVKLHYRQTPEAIAAKAEAIRLHTLEDLSVNTIGFKLGKNPGTIQRWLKQEGVYKCGHRPKLGKVRLDGLPKRKPPAYERRISIDVLQRNAFLEEWKAVRETDDNRHWLRHPIRIHHYGQKRWKAEYQKRKQDITYQFTNAVRHRLWKILNAAKAKKFWRTFTLLGCDVHGLMRHLESQFKHGMTLANYGTLWEVDHIRPCSSFDLKRPDHQQQCFHYTNLQPLLIPYTRQKNSRWQGLLIRRRSQ